MPQVLHLLRRQRRSYSIGMITNIIIAALLAQLTFVSTDIGEPRIGFSFVRGSLVVVPVTLNGRGGYRFLLDTGATHSILAGHVAAQLNLPDGPAETLLTAGGSIPVTIRTMETVQIGSVHITQMRIAVADFELLRTLHVDGIIGADYLKQFKISIDYTRRVLSLELPSS